MDEGFDNPWQLAKDDDLDNIRDDSRFPDVEALLEEHGHKHKHGDHDFGRHIRKMFKL